MGLLRSRSVLVVVERRVGGRADYEVVCSLVMLTVYRVSQSTLFRGDSDVVNCESRWRNLVQRELMERKCYVVAFMITISLGKRGVMGQAENHIGKGVEMIL